MTKHPNEDAFDLRAATGTLATTPAKLIALTGKAGAGKSTVADFLIDMWGYERIKFAGPLKDMMYGLGLNYSEVEGEFKEKPLASLGGKSPRYAMQTLGTEWGREIMGENFWVDRWKADVEKAGDLIVVDDCRFPNEAQAVRDLGGIIVNVDRPNSGAVNALTGKHASETMDFHADYSIFNLDGIPELHAAADKFVSSFLAPKHVLAPKQKKKVYLAGPMGGIPYFNFPEFHRAAADLRARGWYVFNPAEADIEQYGVDISNPTGSVAQAEKEHGFSRRNALAEDLEFIAREADAIALLPGWENSSGAKAEKALADALNLEVIFLTKKENLFVLAAA